MDSMITANSIAEQVAANPVVWSGVIGACVALFSNVMLALFNAWHAAREKSRERTMTLRKEVYLPLVGALPAVMSTFTKLPATPQFDEKPMIEFGSYATRLAAVAETKTAIIAMDLSTTMATTFMDLMVLAMPAHEALTDVGIAREYRVKANLKAELVQAKIDELLQTGIADKFNFEALTANQKYHHDRAQEHWANETLGLQKHAIHTIAYIQKLIELMPELDSLRVKLLLALRRDMGLKTSESEYKATMEAECARMINSLKRFIGGLEQKVQVPNNDNS